MPEGPELRLTSDYINHWGEPGKNLKFNKITKNPNHKGTPIGFSSQEFRISAESKGKEILVWLKDNNHKIPIRMTMGMSGYFEMTTLKNKNKHAHLSFHTVDDRVLSFVDVRRFGKWKENETWSKNRGPCIMKEYDDWVSLIQSNLEHKIFQKPCYEVLMNQSWFNGIGNYIRAEIIYRLDADPNLSAIELIQQHPDFFKITKEIMELSYILGGGHIKDWNNPMGATIQGGTWMKCYGQHGMKTYVDKNNRRFWFNKKWTIKSNKL